MGAQYYRPPNPPRRDWPRDLALMREHGLEAVRFWCCWSWMNPSPGQFDFGDVDELMDLAAETGLKVVLNTILEDAPYWLEARHPAARYTDADGGQVPLGAAMNTPGGGWPGLCFDDDAVWAAGREFLAALVDRYRAHPALWLWDVWNEPHIEPASYFPDRWYCYCPASLGRFRAWLMERYGDVEALNAHWARRYSDWGEVGPPHLFESVPDLMDWREYWFQALRRWLTLRAEVVRNGDGAHSVMTHVALSGFTGPLATHTLDEHCLGDVTDIFGTSSFPEWLMRGDPVEHIFNLEAARAAAGRRPYWQAELQGGKGRRYGRASTRHPRPEDMGLWMWDAVGSGAAGIMFWQWRPELLGPESPGYGLCTPDGTPTARLAAISSVARMLAGEPLASARWHRAGVGVLVSRRTALHTFATDRSVDLYVSSVMGAYRALADGDVHATVVHEDRLGGEGVPMVLYWPMPAVCTDDVAEELAHFVYAGGTLLVESSPGAYDDRGRHRPRWPPPPLADVVGARVVENDSSPRVAISLGSRELYGDWQVDRLDVGGAEVIGRYPDGSPAVTRHHYGRGCAVFIGTLPSLSYEAERDEATRSTLHWLLDLGQTVGAGESAASWVGQRPGLLSRWADTGHQARLHLFLNWTSGEGQVKVRRPFSVLVPSGDRSSAASARGRDDGAVILTVPPHGSLQVVTERR